MTEPNKPMGLTGPSSPSDSITYIKDIILVDIDGTIANIEHRTHLIKNYDSDKNDWTKFYKNCDKDTPIKPIIDMVNLLEREYEIMFFTGREETPEVRIKTLAWLKENLNFPVLKHTLFMRAEGDRRHDTEVKPDLLRNSPIPESRVAFILEDRDSMVKKWRELGFTCLQVAEGDF